MEPPKMSSSCAQQLCASLAVHFFGLALPLLKLDFIWRTSTLGCFVSTTVSVSLLSLSAVLLRSIFTKIIGFPKRKVWFWNSCVFCCFFLSFPPTPKWLSVSLAWNENYRILVNIPANNGILRPCCQLRQPSLTSGFPSNRVDQVTLMEELLPLSINKENVIISPLSSSFCPSNTQC